MSIWFRISRFSPWVKWRLSILFKDARSLFLNSKFIYLENSRLQCTYVSPKIENMKSPCHCPYISFHISWSNVQFIRRLAIWYLMFFLFFSLGFFLSDIGTVYKVWGVVQVQVLTGVGSPCGALCFSPHKWHYKMGICK